MLLHFKLFTATLPVLVPYNLLFGRIVFVAEQNAEEEPKLWTGM